MSWDAAIVGAGPAGSIAALRLARAGHRVLLVDRRRFPREKACGDALLPDAIGALRRNGLYARVAVLAHRADAVRVSSPARIQLELPGEFLCLERATFDHLLVLAAVEAGATLVQAYVTGAREHGDAVELEVAGGDAIAPLRARFAMIATGSDTSLLRPLRMLQHDAPSAVAVRAYVHSTHALDALVVSFDRAITPGYAWIFPLGGGAYNVGCGVFYRRRGADAVDLRSLLDTFLGRFPEARALMRASSSLGAMRGARLRCGLTGARAWNGGRVLACGESLGATFPFTGEGVGKAMQTAELASDALDAVLRGAPRAGLAEYQSRLEGELRASYHGYVAAERWLAHPWVADLVARRARRSPALRATLAGILAETADPRAAFSVGGLARSVLH
ncbi:MAG TPA: geranylgeranyl reductase family protein [Gemmatimonadaceae bacterium]|nr:geranylgeranyl reductase family protein [Gemmatimonadaceae bacterium]